MDLRTQMDYPGASPDQVFAMLIDPGFRAEVCRSTHALEHKVDVAELADGGTRVTVTRVMPAEVPALVKSFVGEQITIEQTEVWTPRAAGAGRSGTLAVRIIGQPATVDGTITLKSHEGGTRELISADVKVSIPFVGRMVEPELVKGLVAASEVEQRVGRARLATSS